MGDPATNPAQAHVTEVLPTEDKLRSVDTIVRAGFTSIEVTSFMRPDVVPALADADEVVRRAERAPGVRFRALVPNRHGALRALDAGADELVALVAVSDAYTMRHQNGGVDELVERAADVLAVARDAGAPVEVALAMPFFDPYAGDVPPERVEDVVDTLLAAGATAFYVATSTGVESPAEVRDLILRLRDGRPQLDLGLHLHNANGRALATALLALQAGVVRFESALCGLGGGIALPVRANAGNVATEDLVAFLAGLGVDAGLDPERVTACAREVGELLGVEPRSYAAAGGTKADLVRAARLSHQG